MTTKNCLRPSVSLLLLAVLFFAVGATAGAEALPSEVKAPGSLDARPSPDGQLQMFYLFPPPEIGQFGVADASGTILWKKTVGFRPILDYVWAKDGKSLLLVTDCIQPEAELRSLKESTRSYFFVLEAATGKTLAQGDLDTEVLDLPKQLPDAVGASHLLEAELTAETLSVTIDHRGKKVSGQLALSAAGAPGQK